MIALLPIIAVVLVSFLVVGLALPVLPLHVHQGLGLGSFAVGLVAGSQFAASVLSRVWAGHYADTRGPKRAVMAGLVVMGLAGALHFLSLRLVTSPLLSVAALLLGRAILGAASSAVLTGALSWGMARTGPQAAGRVIALVGTGMFAAFALGAPLGTALYGRGGFALIAAATLLGPVLAILLAAPLASVPAEERGRPALTSVARAVWLPGIGAGLSSVGFGAIIAFGSLHFAERGWQPVWLPFSAFAAALIAARLVFGDLTDRLGGAPVAGASILVEAAGLALIWFASGVTAATAGAALAGFGYALVYPGLGAEAVRRAPVERRGLAMGAYTIFPDIALGVSAPALGVLADRLGLGSVFLCSALVVVVAVAVAVVLIARPGGPR